MPRRRSHARLEQICDAAVSIFSVKGYRRARMNEIAAAAGVAPGTLYLYVESKEALFLLVVEWLSLRESLPTSFPVATPLPGETVRILRKGLRQSMGTPILDRALASPRAADITREFEEVVEELYRLIHENRRMLSLVERAAADWPELYDVYFVRDRRRFHQRLADYLEQRVTAGQLQPIENLSVATRFLSESVSWLAWKRMSDIDAAGLDDDVVRSTLGQLLTRSFTRPSPGRS